MSTEINYPDTLIDRKSMINIFNCLFPQLVSVFLYAHNHNSPLINAQVLSKGHLKLIQRNA